MTTNKYFDFVIQELGSRQDYFPGTGGNISLKIDDETMIIKASGKRVLHMKEHDGVVALTHTTVKEYFHNVTPSLYGEKESDELIVSTLAKGAVGRPSIETGFHALLPHAVIHSHSVYVNMFACSTQFEVVLETIFLGSGIPYMSIEYAKPGYYLTHLFLEKVRRLSSRPKVIFMKNHGIVVSASSMEEAVYLHEEVNIKIKQYFNFKEGVYPKASLITVSQNCFVSNTPLLQEFIVKNIAILEKINNYILFPDLTVFCQDIAVTTDASTPVKININKYTGKVIYKTNEKEAYCIEENLIAFAFLMTYMKEHHLPPVYISEVEANSIRNMEQEKYRKMLLER